MKTYEEVFLAISGGDVLDIATGSGGFVTILVDSLKDYTQITGIDTSERGLASAREAFPQDNIRFLQMDASHLEFQDSSFDTVSIAGSLHHLKNLPQAFGEMMRVLKPGGRLIVAEMYRDGQTEPQMTHVLLHHWWAAIDMAQGITQFETFPRQKIVDMLNALPLRGLEFYDVAYLDGDPKEAGLVGELDRIINRYNERTVGMPYELVLQQSGEELRQRVKEVGFCEATSLLAIGIK